MALITPFDEKGNVNFLKLKQLVSYQYFKGSHGIVVLGTTGESTSLTEEEKENIVKCVVKENNNRLKIVVGVIENNTENAIKKAKLYESLGADYLLVLTPFYTRCNDEGLYQHFKLISESVNIPIVLYNVPSRTGVNISIDILKKLKEIPNIIGIKEATNDINHIIEVSQICDNNFYLYGGNDELSYLFLSLNAKGLINVVGNYDPSIMHNLISIYQINPYLAHKYFLTIYSFFKVLFIEVNPIPIKELMNYLEFDVGKYRLPLCGVSVVNKNKLIEEYIKYINKN